MISFSVAVPFTLMPSMKVISFSMVSAMSLRT